MAAKEGAGEAYSKRQVYRELANRFNRSEKAFEYRMQNISAVLDELGQPWINGLKPAANVGEGVKPRLVALLQGQTAEAPQGGSYRYGGQPHWKLALDAVVALGGTASPQQAFAWILARFPDYVQSNLGADLAALSVNSPSRTSYSQNSKPRRTDQGSQYDRLFKIGDGPGVVFELYDPAQHGVWEIFPDATAGNRHGMGVRQVVNPVTTGIADAVQEAENTGAFDAKNVEDARKRVLAGIVRRQGQPAFRKALIDAYGGSCAITGCALIAILEAAHVHPYRGEHTNVVSNGLLLRTDIHTLFDLRLIAIDPETLTVLVSPELDGTDYARLRGGALLAPTKVAHWVSVDALTWHRSRCGW
ncbi:MULTISPECIES: HNH endonuclease [Lysobacteraceae]|nr:MULTISPECIES: HNH endonuclease [Lysobacter]